MARPREFSTETVLRQAMAVFWKRGYAATSMADIYEATGLKPGSLYAAFKDKEQLFRQVFETYAAYFRTTLPADAQGIVAIEAWLALQARFAASDPERRGCLIINTVLEREVHSEANRALAAGRLNEIRDYFIRQLGVAAADGELPKDVAIDVQADALLGAVVSIMALGRAGADSRQIENVRDMALRPLLMNRVTTK